MNNWKLLKFIFILIILGMGFYIVKRIFYSKSKEIQKEAVFLGVENYGNLTKGENLGHSLISKFKFNFYIDGKIVTLDINNEKKKKDGICSFDIQNQLQEGYIYDITINNDTVESIKLLDNNKTMVMGEIKDFQQGNFIQIDGQKIELSKKVEIYQIVWRAGNSLVEKVNTDSLIGKTAKISLDDNKKAKNIYLTFVSKKYIPPIIAIPGRRTLKNFLTTALQPVGTTLYIYGGSWDWQDEGSSIQAKTIGIPQSWIDFYQYQNANYTYRDKDDDEANKNPSNSYYPYGEWNQYFYAGADCSGYVGWCIYNTLNSENGKEGYVMGATKMAKTFAENSWGTWTQDVKIPQNHAESDFKVGGYFQYEWTCLD